MTIAEAGVRVGKQKKKLSSRPATEKKGTMGTLTLFNLMRGKRMVDDK
jgi:hypothetical protein